MAIKGLTKITENTAAFPLQHANGTLICYDGYDYMIA
jgi:hypothetical protein